MRNWHGVTAALCAVLLTDCGANSASGGDGASAGLGGATGSAAGSSGAPSGDAGSAPLSNGGSTASAGSSASTNAGSSGTAGYIAGSGGGVAGSGGTAGANSGAGGANSGAAGANSGAGGAGTAGASSVAPNVQGTPECDAFCTKLAKCPGAMCDTFDCRILPGSCAAETRAMLTCTTNTGKFMCEGNGLYEVTNECPRMPDLCK